MLRKIRSLSHVNTNMSVSLREAEHEHAVVTGYLEDAERENTMIKVALEDAERQNAQMYGGEKVIGKEPRIAAIGMVLVSALSVIMKNTQPLTRLRTVCDCIFGTALFGIEATRVALSEVYKKYIYDNQHSTFSSWRVLRAIDLSPVGGLNYNGIETLRKVEGLNKHQRGVLPSRSSIQKASYELYSIGQETIPFEKKDSPLGEVYQYEFEKFIRFMLKTFGLHDIAQTDSVELCITLDGAELCDGLCHLTAGIKLTDGSAVDPRDGTPLSCLDETTGRLFSTQSRNYCFAMKSLLGKDSKTAYKEFSDFFSFFDKLQKEGLAASDLGPRILPVTVWSPQDLSSVWKCLGTGSGA